MSLPPAMPDLPQSGAADRSEEWFVPRVGPQRFRIFIGLLFLPYTGMVLGFTVLGAMLAPIVDWARVGALLVIYTLALGIGAHALDALGSKTVKPWGTVFSARALKLLAFGALTAAYGIGAWYMQHYAPWLWPVALAEGFFVLAYNLEWFNGRFHTDHWFALSWGALPALAGYLLQTNQVSLAALAMAGATAALSLVEIKASRPYKTLKAQIREGRPADRATMMQLEAILKAVTLGTVLLAGALALARAEFAALR